VNNKDLKELMEFISQSNFVEFELERENFKLKLVKEIARRQAAQLEAVAGQTPTGIPAAPPPVALAGAATVTQPAPSVTPGADVYQVTSPMVGTFYRASNPNAPPFVQVGDIVKKGQVICIIEAMKLMNEIESEVAGEIIEIPVSNGQPVEYGEVLFRIRPVAS